MKGWKKALMIVGIVLAVLAVLALALYLVVTHDWSGAAPVSVAGCDNPYISQTGRPMVSAHRSGGGIAPENTLAAFRNVAEADFRVDIFEFDLALTKDDELILLHDETLDRTSDAAEVFGHTDVKPADHTYEELRALNMGENFVNASGETPYRGLRGEDIPEDLRVLRLEDLFDFLDGYGEYRFIIEIKDDGERGCKAADRIYEVLKARDMLSRAIIGTFHGEVTEYMDKTYPDMLRSAGVMEVVELYLNSLLGIDKPEGFYHFVALQIPDEDYVVKLGTTRLVNYAHRHNIAVQYWTVNDASLAADLASKGADAIMSDYPDMIYELFKEGTP